MKLTVADYLDQVVGNKVLITENETTASKVQQKNNIKKSNRNSDRCIRYRAFRKVSNYY